MHYKILLYNKVKTAIRIQISLKAKLYKINWKIINNLIYNNFKLVNNKMKTIKNKLKMIANQLSKCNKRLTKFIKKSKNCHKSNSRMIKPKKFQFFTKEMTLRQMYHINYAKKVKSPLLIALHSLN